MPRRNHIFRLLMIIAVPWTVAAAQPPEVVFLEPAGQDTSGTVLPTFRIVDDSSRIDGYRSWLDNEPARWALGIYRQALDVARESAGGSRQPSVYYIALIPGGNDAGVGFRLADGSERTGYPDAAYVRLGPDEWRFNMTLLHETGHVVLSILNAGKQMPGEQIASFSHTTAALTDRKTAFDEGYAIHLETLLAHLSDEQFIRNKYKHQQALFGNWPGMLSEYFRPLDDLMTFSQTRARYAAVRDNTFSFESAFQGPDYLRVQMETPRDYATLRDADQLLQSEGFYATFFYDLLVRGKALPPREDILKRQEEVLRVIAYTLAHVGEAPDTPYLLHFVENFRTLYPESFPDILNVFLDLSRGVFVDRQARKMWHDLYLAALRLDREALHLEDINAKREDWRAGIERNPAVLYSRIGPQIRCAIPGTRVDLVALETSEPVSFDINTAQEGVLRLIPGISEGDIRTWMEERGNRPFASVEDFQDRVPMSGEARSALEFAK